MNLGLSLKTTGSMSDGQFDPVELINYSWNTTQPKVDGIRYLADIGRTPYLNAELFYGRGVKFNGVDQNIISGTKQLTTQSAYISFDFKHNGGGYLFDYADGLIVWCSGNTLKVFDGVSNHDVETLIVGNQYTVQVNITGGNITVILNNEEKISEAVNTLTNAIRSIGIGSSRNNSSYSPSIVKNLVFINQSLTLAQIENQYTCPEKFIYIEVGVLKSHILPQSVIDNVLVNMPMCETGNTVIDLVTMMTYPIANYTTAVRDNAINLKNGLQTCFWTRDVNGVPTGSSFDKLECDGIGYADIPTHTETVDITVRTFPYDTVGDVLSGNVSLPASGLIVEQENDVILSSQAVSGVITIGSGYKGNISIYKEE